MIVKPDGPIDARILLLGEAPGREEDLVGRPFIGASGRLLSQLLKQTGIKRESCILANVIPLRPPDNKLSRLEETGLTLERCKKDIVKYLIELKRGGFLNVIIPLGAIALETLMGKTSVSKWRGSILESTTVPGLKVVPTFHPAYLMRSIMDTPLVIVDFKKALLESKSPFLQKEKKVILTRLPFERIMEELSSLEKEPFLSLDIETVQKTGIIKCVQLASSSKKALVIPICNDGPYWTLEEEVLIWEALKKLLSSPTIRKIIQNEHFEKTLLYPYVGEIAPMMMDTMIGHHLCYPELKKNLALLTSLYTNEPFYKDDAKDAFYQEDALWEYGGKDALVTFEVAFKLRGELRELGMETFLSEYQQPFSHLMWKASMIGIKVDVGKVREHRRIAEGKLAEARSELFKIAGKVINVNSPKQVARFVYDDLKLPKRFSRATGGVTTDEKALLKLSKLFPHPAIKALLEARKWIKLIGTFLKEFWDADERVRCSWVITGTVTGRLSSRKNIFGTGLNMQNLPSKAYPIRDIFVADEGSLLIKADLEQADARVVAYESENEKMMKVFEDGKDIFSEVASWIYQKKAEMVGKGTFEREKAKRLVHAANYDIGPRAFAFESDVREDEAKWLLSRYRSLFGIEKWHLSIQQELRKDRTLVTALGRRRTFFDWWGPSLFREAYAYKPQSTVGDLINQIALEVSKHPELPSSVIVLLQIHDELVMQAKEEDVSLTVSIIKEVARRKIIEIKGRKVNIPIKVGIGKNWLEAGRE